jgi:hypothetical protein
MMYIFHYNRLLVVLRWLIVLMDNTGLHDNVKNYFSIKFWKCTLVSSRCQIRIQESARMQNFAPFTPELLGALSRTPAVQQLIHYNPVSLSFSWLVFVYLVGGSGQFNRNLCILLTLFYRKLIQNIRRIIWPLWHFSNVKRHSFAIFLP